MMKQGIIFLSFILFSCVSFAQQKTPFIQVDLILFSQQSVQQEQSIFTQTTGKPQIKIKEHISKQNTPFHLLPTSASQLNNEYWELKRKPQYQVLANYSWHQPKNNNKVIEIPPATKNGWTVEGVISLTPGNYYQLKTDLLFSSPTVPPFKLVQQQRIKAGKVYYLDHPQAGALIKIHQVG